MTSGDGCDLVKSLAKKTSVPTLSCAVSGGIVKVRACPLARARRAPPHAPPCTGEGSAGNCSGVRPLMQAAAAGGGGGLQCAGPSCAGRVVSPQLGRTAHCAGCGHRCLRQLAACTCVCVRAVPARVPHWCIHIHASVDSPLHGACFSVAQPPPPPSSS